MERARTVIEVCGLTKRYGEHFAVRSVDLRVAHGEVFALLGPNGAGKTTAVEIMEGVRERTSGSVTVLGEDPAAYTRHFRDRVGVVPQSTGAFDDLKLVELIRHFSRVYSRPLPVGQVIELVGLTDKTNAVCRTLSGGQRRRVDMALSLVGDPDLIFLDEPTTGLDPEVRRQSWEVVQMLAARGTTILLTTHYLDEAEALADRVGIMIDGTLVETGPPDEIGGRRKAAVTVSFRRPDRLAGIALPAFLVPAEIEQNGSDVAVHTDLPSAVTKSLIDWSIGNGVDELPALRVHQPSLEDIYLHMISARQADADQRVDGAIAS